MHDDSSQKGPVENPRWIERRCTCHSAEEWEGNDWENRHPGPGGRGNTPREHMFAAGHQKSKGVRKTKKDNDMVSLFQAQADKIITVKGKDGKPTKLTQAQYLMMLQWQTAMKGSAKAGKALIDLGLKLAPPAEPEGEEAQLSDAERMAVANFLSLKDGSSDAEEPA